MYAALIVIKKIIIYIAWIGFGIIAWKSRMWLAKGSKVYFISACKKLYNVCEDYAIIIL